ncbi:restriction endonuclease [Stenotrophomonas sp. Iso1]|uniref:restriction endonuclease n=1 Tax=Stenotrophomonas sp. Iso1 TaxID=2977283 RepID=UPI0022B783FF|nr:restriction endonuclease [Stenotrophomonas sp. Iso1]
MFSWILALALALVLWGLAAAYMWLVKRRKTEIRHGLAALAGLRWREFSQIVRQAMADQRNLLPLTDNEDNDRGTSSDFLLQQNEQRWLVSCKHGRAYRFDATAVSELASAMRLTGAVGGLLITEGHVDRDGLNEAQKQSIEVFDERNLWQLLKPYVSDDMRQTVTGIAQREAARHTGIAGLAALTIGLLAGMGYLTMQTDEAASSAASAALAPAKANAADTHEAAAPVTASTDDQEAGAPVDAATQIADPDPATLLRYQQSVSKALARTPGVVSGIWLTRSTLSVERSGDDAQVWPLICQELERYPALRTVRVQLNPRPGVEESVRWRQCRTY